MTAMVPDPRRTKAALGAVLALIAAGNVVRSVVVPGHWHFWLNLLLACLVVAVGLVVAGLDQPEVGFGPGSLRPGLMLGAMAFAAVSVVVVAAGVLFAESSLFDDGRTDVTAGAMLWRVLVVIPIGTVLVEELIFRGVVFGLLHRLVAPRAAIVWGAVVFGLWHLLPVWRSAGGDGLTDGAGGGRGVAVVGTFVATFVAGLVFGWLRERSGSVLAPMGLHLATNSVVFAVAWQVAR